MPDVTAPKMPALFVGHGSPMNAIEENDFTRRWRALGGELPRPKAVLCVSAHWFTRGTRVNTANQPRTVYDMYGFPDELYALRYEPPGAPALAREALRLLPQGMARADESWGLDHGAWSVLCRMFPQADIPVCQLSVDAEAAPAAHFAIGRALAPLREQGVLLLSSGNVVHNLRRVEWENAAGAPWADAFDAAVRDAVLAGDYAAVAGIAQSRPEWKLASPTPDHFLPLLYILGAADGNDACTVFNDARTMGSLSMTGYLFTPKTQPQKA